jgi:hypothetical protein
MENQTHRDIARLLLHVNFNVERFNSELDKEEKRVADLPVTHLRRCLRESLIMQKFEKIKERLI